ncbi:cell division control protein 6 homolog isoform X1 [Polyergus mexicanus]|uniref:cell division control protein 6 homolog isoform X1 n=1 Tax=Polyergus mexicanus TaxID=615972 RepID=UPI0038B66A05
MSGTQTTISFPIRKKCSFYGRKEDIAKEDFTDATARYTPSKYTPTVKKIVTLTSSESESDSDIENTTEKHKGKIVDRRMDSADGTPRSRRRKCNGLYEEHTPSPPKQRRNKSQGRNKSPLTPSTLLDKLHLSAANGSKLNPKQLFKSHLSKEEDNLNSNLLSGSNKYQNARKALHSCATEELPGREEQLAKLQKFFQKHLEKETSGSLYVSGPPGTGKTASLFKIMQQSNLRSKLKIVYINCTSMKSAAAIYAKIIQELAITSAIKSGKNGKAIIERYLTSKNKSLLLVLDEIDQLESKKQSVLYSIFEWPSIPESKLILVGIANALDLTDRILPRLQARCELKPTLIHFAPYTKQQIFDIISARLNQANANGVFTPSAIQLLAGKVAAISGDIRRALDISRRVVELAESHQVAQVLRPTNDNDTNIESLKQETEVTEKPVDLKEVVTILNGVYGGTQNIDQEQDTFPLQQKLLLCSLLLILNKGRNKDVTVGKLHEVYKKVCKKRNIFAVDDSEFVNLCSLIETRGILRVVGKKEARLCKVNLQWDQEELDAALQDKQMMADIINDTNCL